ncbi:hypothetical protein ABLG96_09310 [Nakamurella sp. A5-74]|uniref:WXG100 family type VII secretion target n=1 Tax=Nakamurella sp. A5-74 TaxID=3158264 RepID=A0AAU8DTY6_9ACTN
MATGLKGMNTEQGRKLATSCTSDAQQILTITKDLTRQLQETEWYGQDADTFRNSWTSQYTKALKQVATALEGASAHLKKEAAAQDQASGA